MKWYERSIRVETLGIVAIMLALLGIMVWVKYLKGSDGTSFLVIGAFYLGAIYDRLVQRWERSSPSQGTSDE